MNELNGVKAGTTGDGPESTEERVAFTSEQQARVQELIDSAYKRAYSKATGSSTRSDEVKRLENEIDKFKEYKKNSMIVGAISRHNVVDVAEVAELIAPRLSFDESGGLGVRDDAIGQNVGIEEYVADWLGERPHHLRSSGHGGAGSQSAKFGASKGHYDLSDPGAWRSMPREDLDRLLKEGINIHGSQGQVFGFKDVQNPFKEARKKKFNS